MTPACLPLTTIRFTPLDAHGRPVLKAARLVHSGDLELVARIDLLAEEESVQHLTAAGPRSPYVKGYEVTLGVYFPGDALTPAPRGVEELLGRLRQATIGLDAGAALEGWIATGTDTAWGYVGFPRVQQIVRLADEDEGGGEAVGPYRLPEGHRELVERDDVMVVDFCTMRTGLGAEPWPQHARPVLRREGGQEEPLPVLPETHYTLATTPIPPPVPAGVV